MGESRYRFKTDETILHPVVVILNGKCQYDSYILFQKYILLSSVHRNYLEQMTNPVATDITSAHIVYFHSKGIEESWRNDWFQIWAGNVVEGPRHLFTLESK